MEEKELQKAITAYRFQIFRYHTWMNYYALFHGALLIAYYNVYSEVPTSNSCTQIVPLSLIIATLGVAAGVCWLGTVIGNKKWIESWISIIHYIKPNSIYNEYCSNGCKYGFLSTQKIMCVFTSSVSLAWFVTFISELLQRYKTPCCCILLITFLAILLLVLFYCRSDIKGMKDIYTPQNKIN